MTSSNTEAELAKEECGNCRFWRLRSDLLEGMGGGYCVRFPPIFQMENALNDGFPMVSQQTWCGEWQGKLVSGDPGE